MRRLSIGLLMVLLASAVMAAACPALAATVKTTKVTLNRSGTVSLYFGETLDLAATLKPINSTQAVRWSTSSSKIATVKDGRVTASSTRTGTATITAKSGTKKATVKIKVVDPTMPTRVTLDQTGTVRLNFRETLALTPTAYPDTAVTTYKWKTSNKKIARVSADGVVSPVKEGTAKITVTTKRGDKKATVKVKVVDPIKATRIELDRSGTVKVPLKGTLQLNATVTPADATSWQTWSSSKTKYATVSQDGVVTAKSREGTTTITIKTSTGKKDTVKVKVYDPTKPTSIKLDRTGTVKLNMGTKLTLIQTVSPETAVTGYKWSTSNSKIVTVSNGEVTPVGEGTATVTVTTTNNKKKASVKIKVYDDGTSPIPVSSDYKLPYVVFVAKKTHTLAIVGRDANGDFTRLVRAFPTGLGKDGKTKVGTYTIKSKERWHKWGSTSYSPYASKHSGGLFVHGPIFTAKKADTLKPATYNAVGTNCSSGCLRTVSGAAAWVYYNCPKGTLIIIRDSSRYSAKRPKALSSRAKSDPTDPGVNYEVPVTKFTVTPGTLELNVAETATLAVSNIEPGNTTSDKTFTYRSSDEAVATVSATGVVTAVGAGEAKISVISKDVAGLTRIVPVTVVDPNAPAETPETGGNDPVTGDDPDTGNDDSGTGDDPATGSDEPGAGDDPDTGDDDPGTGDDPVTGNVNAGDDSATTDGSANDGNASDGTLMAGDAGDSLSIAYEPVADEVFEVYEPEAADAE